MTTLSADRITVAFGDQVAVDDVSLAVDSGASVGLVGESGSGKTTVARVMCGLQPPGSGEVRLDGQRLPRRRSVAQRRAVQMVFQDPFGSLNPRRRIGSMLTELLRVHGLAKGAEAARALELLELVGLPAAALDRYPAAFSGGQRQRIAIARSLAAEPRIVIADEPVSALDVSIQAGVINLLEDLKGRLGLSYLFVAHDLAVVRHIADRVAIMYLGKIVEIGDGDLIFQDPQHPYTKALLSAIPVPDPAKERTRERILLVGDLPSAASPPSGCRFRTRCQLAAALGPAEQARCAGEIPELTGDSRKVACHFHDRSAV